MNEVAVRKRPQRYRPPGDSQLRDALLAVIAATPEDQRIGLALLLCVDTLEALAKHSLSPTQTRMAAAHADIARDLIPADVREMWNRTRRVS